MRPAARLALFLIDIRSAKRRIARLVLEQQQVGEADDRGQHVVEVVRDAAGELAHRLHLLALRELRLELVLVGHVEGVDVDAARASRRLSSDAET